MFGSCNARIMPETQADACDLRHSEITAPAVRARQLIPRLGAGRRGAAKVEGGH
jgi:hypothetical protein